MSTPEEQQAQLNRDKAQRRQSERDVAKTGALSSEAVSLWERIRLRRQQNGFGEDFEIALTRR